MRSFLISQEEAACLNHQIRKYDEQSYRGLLIMLFGKLYLAHPQSNLSEVMLDKHKGKIAP